MYFDRFDICNAWYVYSSQYHSGQSSKLYAKMCQLDRMGYTPGLSAERYELTDNAAEIFNNLVAERKYQ